MCIYKYIIILYYISSRFNCNVQTNTEIPDVFTTMFRWSHGPFPLNGLSVYIKAIQLPPKPKLNILNKDNVNAAKQTQWNTTA